MWRRDGDRTGYFGKGVVTSGGRCGDKTRNAAEWHVRMQVKPERESVCESGDTVS